jgi:hypothetical protein
MTNIDTSKKTQNPSRDLYLPTGPPHLRNTDVCGAFHIVVPR